ncbi:MAG: 50S ribosomal protein L11 methyltransferase [Vicingaceae bacterium]
MAYLEYRFQLEPFQPYNEILVAQLAEIGFDSFIEKESTVFAYAKESEFKVELLEELDFFQLPGLKVDYDYKVLPKENWNKKWEESFEPIQVDNFCLIRAPFHAVKEECKYEIIIEPKMSFGTGHHATTQLMIRQMKGIELENKTVLDMGSGTGILAILAQKMGAKKVTAIDIEEWAFENMQENVERNHSSEVTPYLGGLEVLEENNEKYDLILANINKNILFEQLPTYRSKLRPGGNILLSGFFDVDTDEFEDWAQEHHMTVVDQNYTASWACLRLKQI